MFKYFSNFSARNKKNKHGGAGGHSLVKDLGSLGLKTTINRNAHLEGFVKNIHIGRGVYIDRDCTIRCDDQFSVIKIGDGCVLTPYSFLSTHRGNIELGKKCSINAFSVLYGLGGLKIGNYVRIAAHVVIVPANHRFDSHKKIYEQGLSKQGVVIEDDVWIGAGAKILDGCHVGQGSVIAAGTVLTKSVDPYSIVAGIPGRVIGNRGCK